jgi:uncharacterized protein with PIN domain
MPRDSVAPRSSLAAVFRFSVLAACAALRLGLSPPPDDNKKSESLVSNASSSSFASAAWRSGKTVLRTSRSRFDPAQITVEPVTEAQARIAREAYRDFGKGSGHPAKLNFGDCFAYALAKVTAEPLLFKGDDFARTDIEPARQQG